MDEYYTQGINFSYASPSFKKIPTNKILLRPVNAQLQYGLSLQHNAYTPQSIEDKNIRYGDRPYAASLMLQSYVVATDTIKKHRITTQISLGVMGYIAGGEWMQKTIHRETGNVAPQGWDYQIANDAVVNYKLQYEKTVLQLNNILMVNATGSIDAGTLLTKASAGGDVMFGYFNNPYSSKRHWFSMYLYTHAQLHGVGYDATLQGGLFNKASRYTVPAKDVQRLVFDNRYGVVIGLGRVYLEYFRYNITKEYTGCTPHSWGGVQAGLQW